MANFFSIGHWYLIQTAPLSDLIACAGGMAIAARAASSITSERERQTWDSLVSTPIEARDLVWAKVLGGVYAARWLVVLLVVMWGLGAVLDSSLLAPLLASLASLLIVLLFGCALGVFYSAAGTSSLRAMGSTLGTLFFVGGGYLFCCVPLLMTGPGGDGGEVILAPCIPFLLIYPLLSWEVPRTSATTRNWSPAWWGTSGICWPDSFWRPRRSAGSDPMRISG